MYWLITYQWQQPNTREWIVSNELHEGRIGEWMLGALEQPESWVFLNAQEITDEEYGDLMGRVG